MAKKFSFFISLVFCLVSCTNFAKKVESYEKDNGNSYKCLSCEKVNEITVADSLNYYKTLLGENYESDKASVKEEYDKMRKMLFELILTDADTLNALPYFLGSNQLGDVLEEYERLEFFLEKYSNMRSTKVLQTTIDCKLQSSEGIIEKAYTINAAGEIEE
jgi:hypothetical protein